MRVLLLHPEFPETFWSFGPVLELVGRKALNPPLGLVTVAALLPQEWEFRLVDCAVRRPTEDEWAFADLVMLTGMIVQREGMLRLIAEAKAHGKPIVVGGPFATSVPETFEEAGVDYLVLDEGELSLPPFLAHLAEHGIQFRADAEPALRFTAKGDKPALTETPVPRFDLLERSAYDAMALQYSRGCPFLCEFCDIITLYGRRPRTKTNAQVRAELDALYDLGWRGGIFFVDDNFIGNKPNVKRLLPDLLEWQQAHGFPFYFDTEASLDLAADPDLVALMVRCGFASVFIGIETPDTDSLELTLKRQNNRAPMLESLEMITRAGLRVMCGMIIGFDNEAKGAGERIVTFIEAAAIPTALLSMLQVLPNTGLYTRLEREGRLLSGTGTLAQTEAINFIPTRPTADIIAEYLAAYRALYDPNAYLDRTYRHFLMLGADAPVAPAAKLPQGLPRPSLRQMLDGLLHTLVLVRALLIVVWRQGVVRATRRRFWHHAVGIMRHNPKRFTTYLAICAHAEHFLPYTKTITETLKPKLAAAVHEGRTSGPAAGHGANVPVPLLASRSR